MKSLTTFGTIALLLFLICPHSFADTYKKKFNPFIKDGFCYVPAVISSATYADTAGSVAGVVSGSWWSIDADGYLVMNDSCTYYDPYWELDIDGYLVMKD